MKSIDQVSVVSFDDRPPRSLDYGTERILCNKELCGSNNLSVFLLNVAKGRQFQLVADDSYHLLYIVRAGEKGAVRLGHVTHVAEEGAGVLLVPGETASFDADAGELELLHMLVLKPPAAIEDGLSGGPGYFFSRASLRALTDASGGRIRRFCAESSVRLQNGKRLTSTNAIQAGEMHYKEGGSSPYHFHSSTAANPMGADHCYITFRGHGVIEVEDESCDINPRTLVFFPPGIPHRLRAQGGPLDYFEVQAWRSFKTTVLSEEPLGLKWFYERQSPGEVMAEWNQS